MDDLRQPPLVDSIGSMLRGLSSLERDNLQRLLVADSRSIARDLPVVECRACSLSPTQESLWFAAEFEAESKEYVFSEALGLKGELSIDALQNAISAVVERHQVLRTTVANNEGTPQLCVRSATTVGLALVDLSQIPVAERCLFFRKEIVPAASVPFVLSNEAMIRCFLVIVGSDDYVLLVVTHHIAVDAWSRSIFVAELEVAYNASIEKVPNNFPPLMMQYADYADRCRRFHATSEYAAQLDYWKTQLGDGIPRLRLSNSLSRQDDRASRGSSFGFEINAGLWGSAREFSRHARLTPFMLLLGMYEIVLSWMSGQEHFAVACPIANRKDPDLENVIGFFANILIIRSDVRRTASVSEMYDKVRLTILDAYSNQDVPFHHVVKVVQPRRTARQDSLCQALFAFQNVPHRVMKLEGLNVSPVDLDCATSRFDLELIVWEEEAELKGQLVYRNPLLTAPEVARIAQLFTLALCCVVDRNTSMVNDIYTALSKCAVSLA